MRSGCHYSYFYAPLVLFRYVIIGDPAQHLYEETLSSRRVRFMH